MILFDCVDCTKNSQNDFKNKQNPKMQAKERLKYDRDFAIYKLYKTGKDIKKIAKQYNVGEERIKQILRDYRFKLRRGNPDIYEIDVMCRTLGWRENERGKLQSTLHKNGYTSFDDKWRELTYNDILAMPLMGPNQACIIWLAQNMDSS